MRRQLGLFVSPTLWRDLGTDLTNTGLAVTYSDTRYPVLPSPARLNSGSQPSLPRGKWRISPLGSPGLPQTPSGLKTVRTPNPHLNGDVEHESGFSGVRHAHDTDAVGIAHAHLLQDRQIEMYRNRQDADGYPCPIQTKNRCRGTGARCQ